MNFTLFKKNHSSETNMNHETSHNKRSHSQFVIVSYIFMIYGIDLNCLNRSRVVLNLLWFVRKFFTLFYIYTFVAVLYKLYRVQDIKLNLKEQIAKCASCLTGVIFWCIINNSKTKLRYLFQLMKNQEIDFKINNSIYFNIFSILWPTLIQITFVIIHTFDFNQINYIHSTDNFLYNLFDLSECNYYYLYYIIKFTRVAFSKTLVSCAILLYITICNHFEKVLLKYFATNIEIISSKKISNDIVASRFLIYDSILDTMRQFESLMSTSIFITFMFNAVETFHGMLILLQKFDEQKYFKIFALLASGFLSFCLISYMAGNVNQADQKARDSNDKLLHYGFTANNFTNLDMKLNLLHENNKPAFTLTAWGFFDFKRSFCLTAIGCILTYALLLINLEV